MAINNIDIALTEFNNFMKEYEKLKSTDIGESDTRSKIIDSMFMNVLGWDECDIKREEKVDSGYYDYKVSTSDFSFIVEAKRNFDAFVLPASGRFASLAALSKGNKDVINQIRNYIFDKSLAFGVITNGHQYIIGQFVNVGGTDWKKNKVVIYRSIDEIGENFIEFYNYLSRESVLDSKHIRIMPPVSTGQVVLDTLKGGDKTIFRNQFSAKITEVILKAFGDIGRNADEKEIELLEYCYIKNNDIKKYNAELDSALVDNAPEIDDRIDRTRDTENLQEKIKEKIYDSDLQTPSPLIIVIGGKGVGKSTFIKYFFNIEISDKVKINRPSIYVDFRGHTEQTIKDSKSICQKIIDTIKFDYPSLKLDEMGVLSQIYIKEINENKKNIWAHLVSQQDVFNSKKAQFIEDKLSNPVSHLEKVSSYLRNHHGKNICMIFDNADQLGDEAQKEAFLFAESLHQRLGCITIISLREGYYNHWKNKPPFDAFHSTVFHISAPPYREVIRKRLEYISEKINFEKLSGEVNNKKVEFTPDGFRNLFKNIHNTLLEHQNSDLLKYLEETSYPNIRLGLDKINKFLVSGHTNITSYMMSDKYRIPIWEFIKAIALDNGRYYHSDESLIFNLLSPVKGNSNHFTKLRILIFLYLESDRKIDSNKFFAVKEIIDVFKLGGYEGSVIIDELSELLRCLLIDNNTYSSDINQTGEISILSKVRITYAGGYYLTHIIQRFFYLELIMQDTPIFSDSYFQKIRSNFPETNEYGKRNLKESLQVVTYFIEYLKESETFDHERTISDKLHDCLKFNVFEEVIFTNKLKEDIKYLSGVINK